MIFFEGADVTDIVVTVGMVLVDEIIKVFLAKFLVVALAQAGLQVVEAVGFDALKILLAKTGG